MCYRKGQDRPAICDLKVENMDNKQKYELLYNVVKSEVNDSTNTEKYIGFSVKMFFNILENEDDDVIMDYYNENYGIEVEK